MINFIKDNRFAKFLDRLATVSRNQVDDSYIDNSPTGLFDGSIGTVLVKNGSDILYRENTDTEFNNISSLLPYIVTKRKYLLDSGVNAQATWVKVSDLTEKQWKFLGYTTPFSSRCDPCNIPLYYGLT
jgi:hypothetical protein